MEKSTENFHTPLQNNLAKSLIDLTINKNIAVKKIFIIKICCSDVHTEKNGLVFFDGLINGAFFSNEQSIDKLNDISETLPNGSCGEWIAIYKNTDGYKIQIDAYGFYSLFYFQKDNYVVISNDISALVSHLRNENLELSMDKNVVSLMLGSSDIFFNHPINNDTCVSQIKSLGFKEEILLNKDGVKIVPNYKKCEISDLNIYEEKINSAISEIGDMLKKIIHNDENAVFHLYLSGGKDSRVCLALLLKHVPKSKIKIFVKQPVKNDNSPSQATLREDLFISTEIIREFNLEYITDDNSQYIEYSVSKSDALFFDLSFLNNNYYSTYAPKSKILLPLMEEKSVYEIRGAGGEVLSQYVTFEVMQKAGANFENTEESCSQDALKIFNILYKSKATCKEIFENQKKYFTTSLLSLPGLNIKEKLDSRYVHHRNRKHFGHMISTYLTTGKKLIPLLCNDKLFSASRYLTNNQRSMYKICYDIIEKCQPELNDYPIQSGYWSPEITNRKHIIKKIKGNIEYASKKLSRSSHKIVNISSDDLSLDAWIQNELEKYLSLVEEEYPELFDEKLKSYLASKLNNQAVMRTMLMKSISALAYLQKIDNDVLKKAFEENTIHR